MDDNYISDSNDRKYESENDIDDSYDPVMNIQITGFVSQSSINIYTLRLQFTRVTQTSLDWFPKAILSGTRGTLAKQQITVLVYERNTKSQNLGYERITSIRLKSAKLKKKTYYHAFLGKILAFKLKYIISEHICK